MSSLVSCIIPVYNGERYLPETLDSVFGQTHQELDVIVADDGSTDRSREVATNYPRPVVCISQENAGHAAARNLALGIARGEFIAFVDADDLWLPSKLAMQLQWLAERPHVAAVFTHLQNFWSPDVDPAQRTGGEDALAPVPGYSSVTMLARRSMFDQVGLFDPSLKHGNDRDWFCRAAEQGLVMEMMPGVLVRRRLHATNRSASHASGSRSEYLRILKASLDRRRKAGGETVQQYPFHSSDPEQP